MTLKELSQLYYLKREIAHNYNRLKELESKLSSPSSSSLSGMPRSRIYGNKIEDAVADIIELKAIIDAQQKQCLYECNRIEQYIANIKDSFTRQIFIFRFVNGLSWRQVAVSTGGGNTEDSVKKICYRYINNENRRLNDQI